MVHCMGGGGGKRCPRSHSLDSEVNSITTAVLFLLYSVPPPKLNQEEEKTTGEKGDLNSAEDVHDKFIDDSVITRMDEP
jgi:hypothetical protein